MTSPITEKITFNKLHAAGKSAALDLNTKTGQLICRASKSANGDLGNGSPGAPYGDDWVRIVETKNGELSV